MLNLKTLLMGAVITSVVMSPAFSSNGEGERRLRTVNASSLEELRNHTVMLSLQEDEKITTLDVSGDGALVVSVVPCQEGLDDEFDELYKQILANVRYTLTCRRLEGGMNKISGGSARYIGDPSITINSERELVVDNNVILDIPEGDLTIIAPIINFNDCFINIKLGSKIVFRPAAGVESVIECVEFTPKVARVLAQGTLNFALPFFSRLGISESDINIIFRE